MQKAVYCKETPHHRTVTVEGLECVGGTGGIHGAAWAVYRGDEFLEKAHPLHQWIEIITGLGRMGVSTFGFFTWGTLMTRRIPGIASGPA
jgi:hypothetical protein